MYIKYDYCYCVSPGKIPTHPGCVSHMIKNVFFLWWSAETGMRKNGAL